MSKGHKEGTFKLEILINLCKAGPIMNKFKASDIQFAYVLGLSQENLSTVFLSRLDTNKTMSNIYIGS